MKIYSPTVTGSLTVRPTAVVTGSVTSLGGFTGSLLGTASYALTASFALNAGGGSGAGFPYSGSAVITGSLLVSQSFVDFSSASYFTGNLTGSLFGTASFARSSSYAIVNESQYRFEQVTVIDQDIWLNNEVITKIVKSAGVNTAEYRTGSAAYNSIVFTGDTFTGQIPVTASDVFSWRITYNSGYTTAALIVIHAKV